jgi:hypothetical protein
MAHVEPQPSRRPAAIAIAAFGGFSLLVGAILGPNEAVAGAAVFIAAALPAMRELAAPTITWPNAIGAFAFVIWLIPARRYRLPSRSPSTSIRTGSSWRRSSSRCSPRVFNGRARFEFLGFGAPLAILAGTATLSAILNYESLSGVPGEGAFKLLSYYLGFLLVFVLVASTIKTQAAMDTAVRALVVGATIGPPRPSTSRAPATTHSITWPSGSPRSSASLVRSSSCAAAASVPMPPRSTRSLSRPPSSWRSRSPST